MPQCLQGLHCNTHCLMSVTHSKIWMKATKCTLTLSRKNTARMIPVAQFQWKTKEQAKEAFSSQRRPKEKTAETIAVMTWHKGTPLVPAVRCLPGRLLLLLLLSLASPSHRPVLCRAEEQKRKSMHSCLTLKNPERKGGRCSLPKTHNAVLAGSLQNSRSYLEVRVDPGSQKKINAF